MGLVVYGVCYLNSVVYGDSLIVCFWWCFGCYLIVIAACGFLAYLFGCIDSVCLCCCVCW